MLDMRRINTFERRIFISIILYQVDKSIKFIIKELFNLTINNSFNHVTSLRLNNKDCYKAHSRFIL